MHCAPIYFLHAEFWWLRELLLILHFIMSFLSPLRRIAPQPWDVPLHTSAWLHLLSEFGFCFNPRFSPAPHRIILGSQSEACPSLALGSCVCVCVCVCVHTKLLQLCLTLCDTMDCRPQGSSVHRILQGRILECIAMSSSGGSSQPRDQPCAFYVSCFRRWVLCH